METRTNPLGWPTWLWGCLMALVLILTAFPIAGGIRALSSGPGAIEVFRAAGGVAIAGFGLMLLIRHMNNRAAALLGMILVSMATMVAPSLFGGRLVEAPAWLAIPVVATVIVRGAFIGYFWPLFSLELSGGPANARQARSIHVLAAAFSVMPAAAIITGLFAGFTDVSVAIWIFLIIGNQLLGYWILTRNYRRNDAAGRNRVKIVLFAFVFFMISSLVQVAGQTGVEPNPVLMPAFSLIGAALLAYAVLSQRLFDFNFALNRTLVYGAVSFVLLAAFGLAKWVIEHLIPESWHAGSEYYSVGIALGLFLILHRVHNSVERNVERFLFSPWHRNEEALRRFVTAAGHFDEIAVLCRALVEETSRFAKGAGAALYLRSSTGAYALSGATFAEALPGYAGDNIVLALMRAERGPVRTAQTLTELPGALAMPMLDHGKLSGFLLLGHKPDGADYRPDEIEALGWAVHQVGLDLQAMRAGELEAENAGLNATVAALSAQLAAVGKGRRRTSGAGAAAGAA